jgi:hypothetical protein
MQSEREDFSHLDDPAFLAERARLRERLAHVPENATCRQQLEQEYAATTAEFLRRARIAWTGASQEGDLTENGDRVGPR